MDKFVQKKKKLNIPFLICTLIFSASLICLVLYLFSVRTEDQGFERLRQKLKEPSSEKSSETEETEDDGLGYYLIDGVVVQEEFKDLYLENSDIIGWVKIDDTTLDYPVMFTPEDSEYYLHKNFEKEYSFDGTPFAGVGTDIELPNNNIILYGHHLVSNLMFSTIDDYENEDFYKEHKYITFDTLRQTGTYEVIGAFRTQVYTGNYSGFVFYDHTNMVEKEFEDYVKNVKDLTPYDTNSAAYGDQLITLSTCAYHTYNGRFVIVAKRIDGCEVDLEKDPIEVIGEE